VLKEVKSRLCTLIGVVVHEDDGIGKEPVGLEMLKLFQQMM